MYGSGEIYMVLERYVWFLRGMYGSGEICMVLERSFGEFHDDRYGYGSHLGSRNNFINIPTFLLNL